MAQRHSEYERRPREDYPTPSWTTRTLLPYLNRARINYVWDPAPGSGKLVRALRTEGLTTFGNRRDFLKCEELPDPRVQAIITNPPFGGAGKLACQFIEHALLFDKTICMLLRVDFDSARTRTHLFRGNAFFAGKLVLLNRIDWWPGPATSSTNHAWFIWDVKHSGPPTIGYVERR